MHQDQHHRTPCKKKLNSELWSSPVLIYSNSTNDKRSVQCTSSKHAVQKKKCTGERECLARESTSKVGNTRPSPSWPPPSLRYKQLWQTNHANFTFQSTASEGGDARDGAPVLSCGKKPTTVVCQLCQTY